MEDSNITFHYCTNADYQNDRALLVDLFQRCEVTNKSSASMNLADPSSSIIFHCEFTDYLQCMEQYRKSYCCQLRDKETGQVIAAYVINIKQVQFGEMTMKIGFSRLARVEPNRRRQYLILTLLSHSRKALKHEQLDLVPGYTLHTNTPSLTLQRFHISRIRKEISLLDIFVIPTESNNEATSLRQLTSLETEELCMNRLVNWNCRPILAELRHIMQQTEYIGTFVSGDLDSGSFSMASIWQPSSAIICDDRSTEKNSYRGSYWLVFNFFQSNPQCDRHEELLPSLSHMAFSNGIPFILCHVERLSIFNELCQQRALAMTTEILSWQIVSERALKLGDKLNESPIWLDPRDFSSLLYFTSTSNRITSHL